MLTLSWVPAALHVPEPSVDETYQILLGLRERYEAHHKLRYTDDALDAAAKYSSQYISDRFLPDKARRRRLCCPPAPCPPSRPPALLCPQQLLSTHLGGYQY